jgi:hypothetical protein
MKLASDVDILVRQLFNPLAIQSIHWFTQKKSGYSEIILSLIMVGKRFKKRNDSTVMIFQCLLSDLQRMGWFNQMIVS